LPERNKEKWDRQAKKPYYRKLPFCDDWIKYEPTKPDGTHDFYFIDREDMMA
jgi:hypothetical protein